MRLPIIPFVIAVTLLGAVWYLFTTTHTGRRTLDVPRLNRIADIDGIETEVGVSADAKRIAAIVSGDVWVLNLSTNDRKQLTRTGEAESFPNWNPDNKHVTFSRG